MPCSEAEPPPAFKKSDAAAAPNLNHIVGGTSIYHQFNPISLIEAAAITVHYAYTYDRGVLPPHCANSSQESERREVPNLVVDDE
jgi:hypothetical protein